MPKSQMRRQMCRNRHFWIEITIRIVLVILFVYVYLKKEFFIVLWRAQSVFSYQV